MDIVIFCSVTKIGMYASSRRQKIETIGYKAQIYLTINDSFHLVKSSAEMKCVNIYTLQPKTLASVCVCLF